MTVTKKRASEMVDDIFQTAAMAIETGKRIPALRDFNAGFALAAYQAAQRIAEETEHRSTVGWPQFAEWHEAIEALVRL